MLKRAESNEAARHRGCQLGSLTLLHPSSAAPSTRDSEIYYQMSTHYSRVAVYNQMNSFKPLPMHWCLPQILDDSRESSGRRRGGSLFPSPCPFLLLGGRAGCVLSASCLPHCFSLLSGLPRWSEAWSTTLLI